jgi:hypothetical protein
VNQICQGIYLQTTRKFCGMEKRKNCFTIILSSAYIIILSVMFQ